MRSITATEAKAKFSALLADVERGEAIEITRHGAIIARIVPPGDDRAERHRRAIEAIKSLKRTGKPTGLTVEDLLSARDEGRR